MLPSLTASISRGIVCPERGTETALLRMLATSRLQQDKPSPPTRPYFLPLNGTSDPLGICSLPSSRLQNRTLGTTIDIHAIITMWGARTSTHARDLISGLGTAMLVLVDCTHWRDPCADKIKTQNE